jgi:hypothetical protein
MQLEDLASQVDRLAKFIMSEIPGEPSQSQGAVDTAIRLLTEEQQAVRELVEAAQEMLDVLARHGLT